MMRFAIELASEAANNSFAWLMLALGVTFSPAEYVGGLFFALAVAAVINRTRKDPKKIWLSVSTAAVCAAIAAWVVDHFETGWPPQLFMAAAGAVSYPAVAIFIRVTDHLHQRSEALADRVVDRVLPPTNGDEDK